MVGRCVHVSAVLAEARRGSLSPQSGITVRYDPPHKGTGNWLLPSVIAAGALNFQAISPSPKMGNHKNMVQMRKWYLESECLF